MVARLRWSRASDTPTRERYDWAVRLAADAAARGATVEYHGRRLHVHWNVAGRCSAPVTRDIYARPERLRPGRAFMAVERWPQGQREVVFELSDKRQPVSMEIEAPCRKCPECLRARAGEWARRAASEIQFWSRTWFGTLTISPERDAYHICKASTDFRKRGDLAGDPVGDEFALIHSSVSRELTLLFKRMRKAGHRFRYLLVTEVIPPKSKNGVENVRAGLPHYHLLVHETSSASPISWRDLVAAGWKEGFTKWKLVDTSDARAAWYACKYLSKDARARVRASAGYGDPISVKLERPTASASVLSRTDNTQPPDYKPPTIKVGGADLSL